MRTHCIYVLLSVLLLGMLVLSSPAQENPDYYYDILQTEKAPVIDGLPDADVWANVPEEPVVAFVGDAVIERRNDFDVTFRMCWKAELLYLFISVIDDTLYHDESLDMWQWDNIEVYFDGDNSDGTGPYDGINDIQLRWNPLVPDSAQTGYGQAENWGFDINLIEWAIPSSDSGYTFEAAIPYEELSFYPDDEFGFELQIGDNDGPEPTSGRVFTRWNWSGGGSWKSTLNHGTAVMVPEMVPVTAVQNRGCGQHPMRLTLLPNYPNPFNPATTISYTLPHESQVALAVYNLRGERITVLENGTQKAAGRHQVEFYGGDLSSGFYFYRLEADRQVLTRRMLLVK